jgi:hypothetical protein
MQSDPNLGSRVPLAIKEADAAVRTADSRKPTRGWRRTGVYLADRKVETPRAQAETSLAEDQRGALSAQREGARLDATARLVSRQLLLGTFGSGGRDPDSWRRRLRAWQATIPQPAGSRTVASR